MDSDKEEEENKGEIPDKPKTILVKKKFKRVKKKKQNKVEKRKNSKTFLSTLTKIKNAKRNM